MNCKKFFQPTCAKLVAFVFVILAWDFKNNSGLSSAIEASFGVWARMIIDIIFVPFYYSALVLSNNAIGAISFGNAVLSLIPDALDLLYWYAIACVIVFLLIKFNLIHESKK